MADKAAADAIDSMSLGLSVAKTFSVSGATTNHDLATLMEPYDSFSLTPGWRMMSLVGAGVQVLQELRRAGSRSLPATPMSRANSNSMSRSLSGQGAAREQDVDLGQGQQVASSSKTDGVSRNDLKSVLLTENLIFDADRFDDD
mmetsp:Transcript_6110/g.13560  ORF Transcript_6110/g.13560 Transcript_6110/m.13560 type:complete len:144 (-) Transcript_6110:340-771(-)